MSTFTNKLERLINASHPNIETVKETTKTEGNEKIENKRPVIKITNRTDME